MPWSGMNNDAVALSDESKYHIFGEGFRQMRGRRGVYAASFECLFSISL